MPIYDTFELGNSSLTATNANLGQNNSSTQLKVPSLYRMKYSNIEYTNLDTASGTLTLSKIGASGTIAIRVKALPGMGTNGATVVDSGDESAIYVESGYYLVAKISNGAGSITGTAEFVPE